MIAIRFLSVSPVSASVFGTSATGILFRTSVGEGNYASSISVAIAPSFFYLICNWLSSTLNYINKTKSG